MASDHTHPEPEGARELRLPVAGSNLAAKVWGPEDGEPVLALHGWLDNAASFDLLAPALHGARLVALDLPGHGRSEHRPAGCRYHFVDYVGDALTAADALAWTRFSLLGHSLGGAVASFVAGAAPERIRRLALIEALGPLAEAPEQAAQRLAMAVAGTKRRPPTRYASVHEAAAARAAAGGLSESAARVLTQRGTRANADGVTWSSDPRLRLPSLYRFTEGQVEAVLAAIRAPTLLVTAERQRPFVGAETLDRRCALLPELDRRILPGGHHLHLENPGPVAEAVAPFLAG